MKATKRILFIAGCACLCTGVGIAVWITRIESQARVVAEEFTFEPGEGVQDHRVAVDTTRLVQVKLSMVITGESLQEDVEFGAFELRYSIPVDLEVSDLY